MHDSFSVPDESGWGKCLASLGTNAGVHNFLQVAVQWKEGL